MAISTFVDLIGYCRPQIIYLIVTEQLDVQKTLQWSNFFNTNSNKALFFKFAPFFKENNFPVFQKVRCNLYFYHIPTVVL